ncbi:MAG: hypothetical protein ACLTDR_03890 [Adlercreutzia equolifaciens]
MSADGTETMLPLGYVIGRHGVLSYEINEEALTASVGGSNQLWMTRTPANYFVRDVVEIVVSAEDEAPAVPGEGDEQSQQPERRRASGRAGSRIAMIAPLTVEAGRPVRFEGYAEDYGVPIVTVQFSLDDGENCTDYDVSGSTGDRWVHWTFEYTPEAPGTYCLLVRSVNERGGGGPGARYRCDSRPFVPEG